MSVDQYKTLDGGLKVNILPMDVTNPIHQAVLGEALQTAVAFEATAHDSNFNTSCFDKIMKAVKSKKIEAWFMIAGWENCIPKVVAAAIDFPTVLTKWDGKEFKHYPAKYREDTSFLPRALRELIPECPKGLRLPKNIGLGEYFEQETMRIIAAQDPSGQIYRGRIAEYSPHSAKMMKIMGRVGADLGKNEGGTILELKDITPAMKDRRALDTETEILTDKNGETLPHVFAVNWSSPDGKQKIVASFTNGISTFTGDPVTRVQFMSNGNLPNEAILKDALSSILAAGKEEISYRQWGEAADDPTLKLESKMPVMRIHAFQEPDIMNALEALGATSRILGSHAMLPVVLDLGKNSHEATRFCSKLAKPHKAVRPTEAANVPCFEVAA